MKEKSTLLIKYTTLFDRQRKAAPPEIKIAFREARELFLDNPTHPHLRNHALREKYAGHRSIDITGDWRAIFIEQIDKEGNQKILFKFMGTHQLLYGKA